MVHELRRLMNHSNPCLKSQPPTSRKTPSSLSGNVLSKYLTVFIHIFWNHFRSYPLPQRWVYSIPHGRIAEIQFGEVDDCDVGDKVLSTSVIKNNVAYGLTRSNSSLTIKNFLKSGTSIINETITRIASNPVLNVPITVFQFHASFGDKVKVEIGTKTKRLFRWILKNSLILVYRNIRQISGLK